MNARRFAPVVAAAIMLGATSLPAGASAPNPFAQMKLVLANANAQQSVRVTTTANQSGMKILEITDAGRSEGRQTITLTSGGKSNTIIGELIAGQLFVKGDAAILTSYLALSQGERERTRRSVVRDSQEQRLLRRSRPGPDAVDRHGRSDDDEHRQERAQHDDRRHEGRSPQRHVREVVPRSLVQGDAVLHVSRRSRSPSRSRRPSRVQSARLRSATGTRRSTWSPRRSRCTSIESGEDDSAIGTSTIGVIEPPCGAELET